MTGRREFLRAGLLGALGTSRLTWARDEPLPRDPNLIVRNPRPLDAESPVEVFDQWLTPNRLFFVRSHFGAPAVGLHPWTLAIAGAVARPATLSLEDLKRFEHVTLPAVLQCSGNGRAFFSPTVPGVGWERGAVGNAEWAGLRLKDLLESVGVEPKAAHVHLLGADAPPSPKTPTFLRSIPMERALDPRTLIATHMNREPLPLLHGGPMRLVVPGWSGNHWIKWLRRITLSAEEAPGFYMQTGYKMPKLPVPTGVNPKPSDLVSVTTLNVKSLFAWPDRNARILQGDQNVRGVAWTGTGRVTKVEVAVNNGRWEPANLVGPDHEASWRQWSFRWHPTPGRYTLRVRATDSSGASQPDVTPWNKSGYLWNGIDQVTCEVIPTHL